jgi:hypothetical protein
MKTSFRPATGWLALALLASAAGAARAQTPGPTVTAPPMTTPAPVVTPIPAMTPARVTTPAPVMTAAPSPSALPSPLATPTQAPENGLVTTRVRQEFDAWQRGRIDRKTYSPAAGGIYDDSLVAAVSPDLTAIGPLQSVQYQTASLLLGDLVYRYTATGSMGSVSVLYALDQRGRTDGIVFTPLIFRTTPTQ